MSYNRRKGSLTPVGNVLQSLFQNSKSELSDQFLRWKLWSFWPQIVGPTLAKSSEPVGYSKGCLYVWVDNSARMQEFSFIAGSMKEKINIYLEKKWVRQIKFTLDRRAVPKLDDSSTDFKNMASNSLSDVDIDPDK